MSLLVDDVSVRIPRALPKFVEQDVDDGRGPGSTWEHAYPVLKPWRICRLFSPTRRQVASATYHRPANSDPLRESTTHGVVPRARSYASTRAGMCAQLRMCGRERVRAAAHVRSRACARSCACTREHHGSDREEACTPRGASTSGYEGVSCPRELRRHLVAHRSTHARRDPVARMERREKNASTTTTSPGRPRHR